MIIMIIIPNTIITKNMLPSKRGIKRWAEKVKQ